VPPRSDAEVSRPASPASPASPALFAILNRPDPTPWLLAAEQEPQARWVTLAHLTPGLAPGPAPGPAPSPTSGPTPATLAAAHQAVLEHPATRALLDRLPHDWATPADVSGHNKPELASNLLDLLADIGLTADDDPRIPHLLDAMLEHTDPDGRFTAHAAQHTGPPVWSCLYCDTHAIADILGRYGRAADPRVRRALATAIADLELTSLGRTWGCRTDPASGFHGPGKAGDPCPQAALEALRAFSWLPAAERPASLTAALPELVHTTLEVWRRRGERKPYMMGHGRQFKQVKWPATWYSAYEIVDVLGRLPEAWRDNPEDRRSLAEIAACLLAYNVASDGRVTPLSTFNGWTVLSLGQKKEPSPLATALVWSRLARLTAPADAPAGTAAFTFANEIAAVDVLTLPSSKGGSGTPMPPKIS